VHGPPTPRYISSLSPPPFQPFFFSSSALFAFWLRSSVVSVLFSLISESVLRNTTLINPIFRDRDWVSALAYARSHRVLGLTLPPSDANHLILFINSSACPTGWRRDFPLNTWKGLRLGGALWDWGRNFALLGNEVTITPNIINQLIS
jgi:hypothetical protein